MRYLVTAAVVAIFLLAGLSVMDAIGGGDVRITADGSATLVSGSMGVSAVDCLADGTAIVTVFRRGVTAGVDFYLRDGVPRAITAAQAGFSRLDSIAYDIDTATELIYTPIP